jgi:L-ribulose-5-phosphate 3-epimerase
MAARPSPDRTLLAFRRSTLIREGRVILGAQLLDKPQEKLMTPSKARRTFLKQSILGSAMTTMAGSPLAAPNAPSSQPVAGSPRFQISLAGWSLHRAIQGNLVKMLDFPRIARRTFGLDAIEPVNTLFEVPTAEYIVQLRKNANDEGVRILLIMCDAEGALAHRDRTQRMKAVQNHRKWVDVAAELECHSIRVNMRGEEKGTAGNPTAVDEFISRSVDAFAELCEYAARSRVNILIENHGGLSSDADVLVRLMKAVNLPNFGTLPDFGNFDRGMDRYEGIRKLMPYAKGVSGKSHDFDAKGNETQTDYERMMKIVVDEAKFEGHVDIEYEGDRLSEYEGIWATKRLLERFR